MIAPFRSVSFIVIAALSLGETFAAATVADQWQRLMADEGMPEGEVDRFRNTFVFAASLGTMKFR